MMKMILAKITVKSRREINEESGICFSLYDVLWFVSNGLCSESFKVYPGAKLEDIYELKQSETS